MDTPIRDVRLKFIPIEELELAEGNTRKLDVLVNLDLLTSNIKTVGLQNPLIVVYNQKTDKYDIISGQRRWLACKVAGLKKIPCLIVPKMDVVEQKVVSLSENLYRNQMNDEDISVAALSLYRSLKSIQEVAKRLGVSEYLVKRYIGYAPVPHEMKQLVDKKLLTRNQAVNIFEKFENSKYATDVAYKIAAIRDKSDRRALVESVKRASSPHEPYEAIRKRADEIRRMKKYVIYLPPPTSRALDRASQLLKHEPEETIVESVEQWLERNKALYSGSE